jgi:hypothetical protein
LLGLSAISSFVVGFFTHIIYFLFGPKRDEVTGDWRKLHNEELHDLYSSPSIIRIMKSTRIRWAEHVTRMGEKSLGCWWESQGEGATRKTTTWVGGY